MKKEGEEAKINENMNFLISLGTPLLFPSHYHHHQQKQRNLLRGCDKRRKYEGYIYQILVVLLTSGKFLKKSFLSCINLFPNKLFVWKLLSNFHIIKPFEFSYINKG